MRISTLLSYANGMKEAVKEVQELEKAGLDMVWVPEAYSYDAPSAMGYIAAKTERVTIASGILPIYTRTPSLLAMTAAGIDYLSDGRCMLGLGASGPQVIEGFHGVTYDAPTQRIREIIEICRMVWRREKVSYDGRHFQIPLPQNRGTGLGKPLEADQSSRARRNSNRRGCTRRKKRSDDRRAGRRLVACVLHGRRRGRRVGQSATRWCGKARSKPRTPRSIRWWRRGDRRRPGAAA